jgi:hypothetical protein
MWIKTNPNPAGRSVGDCAVRALAVALDTDWETAFDLLADAGRLMCDMPSSDSVSGAVLRMHGFRRTAVPDTCPDCYTVRDFCRDHPVGTHVIYTGGHVVTSIHGDVYDSWNSLNEIPIFAWHKEA